MKADTSELTQLAPTLKAGDKVELSGFIYTGRDAAHKRFAQLIKEGKELPFPIKNAVIYYAGPTGTKEGMVIGSCGPTTSGRMDPYTPKLLDMGLKGIIGKGERSDSVVDAIARNKAVYFCAIGGAGALACKCIESCEVIAFEDLGCESVKKLFIRDFPLIVTVDCHGGNLFKTGREAFKR
ncbi:MAG: Fe-S-containing hydro-lyase [Ruminococcaceae bacterium]|nr:Fe-S-containing hydro-lyase [Oscillospiraceae bacterium]